MFRATFYPKYKLFYTDNVLASVTNSVSVRDIRDIRPIMAIRVIMDIRATTTMTIRAIMAISAINTIRANRAAINSIHNSNIRLTLDSPFEERGKLAVNLTKESINLP